MTVTRVGTLIVGASQAEVQLAASLRELGDDEPIRLFGSEPRPPYQRPPLSKAYLAGRATAESLELRSAGWYVSNRVDLRLSSPVASIRLDMDGAGSG